MSLVLVAGLALVVGYFSMRGVVDFATRSCSLSSEERSELARMTTDIADAALAGLLDGGDQVVLIDVAPPGQRRDFGLDQGPQRVCASGAAAVDSRLGPMNISVMVYDMPEAAAKNARSNLDAAIRQETIGGVSVLLSDIDCMNSTPDGCGSWGVQAIIGRTAVVLTSRRIAPDLLALLARDCASRFIEGFLGSAQSAHL